MIRRRHQQRFAQKRTPQKSLRKRSSQKHSRWSFSVERLEDRCLLSATAWQPDSADVFDVGVLANNASAAPLSVGASTQGQDRTIAVSAPPPTNEVALASGALIEQTPFPLGDTFFLHSLPGATKVIYLDFDGFITRETQWNADFSLPNIITPAYDLDDDFNSFSSQEQLNIQTIWERVAEDFRPFEVDVTTEFPGIEALRNTGGSDAQWGQRVVIGGYENDWFDPATDITAGGVSYLGSFTWDSDTPNFVFAADYKSAFNIAEAVSHEMGHALGLVHDGQFRFYENTEEDPAELVQLYVEYYPGHGSGETRWAPIMGVGYNKVLTQWSKGEYFNATNDEDGTSPLQDDLAVIVGGNGFGYRADDHGSTILTADEFIPDSASVDSDVSYFEAEGIVERNTDVDYFSFIVEGLGELVSLDIQPLANGPNLDILAKVYDSTGTVVATSDSIDVIDAKFTDLALLPGTYYVSVEGASRPITVIDPTFHPGPFQAEGNPPADPLPEDMSDWGYTNYGSLGYYSIAGTRKKNLVVGVDFDASGGAHPLNWNSYAGGTSPEVLTNLKSETGLSVPYQLTVSSTGTTITSVASSSPITPSNVPQHGIPLTELAGYLTTTTDTLSFEWSHLTPDTVYQIYVFGHASTEIQNHVTVIGGTWNGVQQVYDFTQVVSSNGLVVNDGAPGANDLTTYSLLVVSNDDGEIAINVQSVNGAAAGVAGLAISTTKVGTLSGQKWDDANGDKSHQASEPGEEGWRIYLDLNNDGQLNKTLDRVVATSAPNVPQNLADYSTVKNELFVTEADVLTDVNVTFDIDHTFDADLNLFLVSPAGTRVKLLGDIGGSGDNFRNTTLDDEASTVIGSVNTAPPYTGTFRPQNALSAFDGEISAGKWTLEITDDATGDTGVLNSWSISITFAGRYLEPNQLTDENGNYTFTDLRAGQYIVRELFSEEQIAAGWKQTIAPAPITVRSGADVVGADFGNWIPTIERGSIAGVVFDDANGNGARDGAEAGLPGWTVYLDANGNGAFDVATAPTVYSASGLSLPIEDFSVVNAPISVSGLVYQLEVTLDITHSFVGDLDAYLLSPSGRQVELFTQVGGQYNNLSNVTLSDSASRSINTLGIADVPYSGTWRPEGLLSDFIGEDMTGVWILQIRDTAYADEGVLNSWSLKITAGEASLVTGSDGSYEFADLPTGSYDVREIAQSGWNAVAPMPASIPGAVWASSKWTVNVGAGTTVNNVSFGNQAVVALPGDYDRTDVVDARDYLLWRKKLGTTVPAPYDGADGNGNGTVDAADYGVWRSNFGATTPAGSGSLALAASGSLAAVATAGLAAENTAETNTVAASAESWGFDSDFHDGSDTQLNARPAYRPAAFAAVSSDQALLAWLAEAGDDDTEVDGTSLAPQAARDAESFDSAFESLEAAMLREDGVV